MLASELCGCLICNFLLRCSRFVRHDFIVLCRPFFFCPQRASQLLSARKCTIGARSSECRHGPIGSCTGTGWIPTLTVASVTVAMTRSWRLTAAVGASCRWVSGVWIVEITTARGLGNGSNLSSTLVWRRLWSRTTGASLTPVHHIVPRVHALMLLLHPPNNNYCRPVFATFSMDAASGGDMGQTHSSNAANVANRSGNVVIVRENRRCSGSALCVVQ